MTDTNETNDTVGGGDIWEFHMDGDVEWTDEQIEEFINRHEIMTPGEIVEARVEDGQIKYVAEFPDGYRIGGIIPRDVAGRHTTMEDSTMEQFADEMIGSSIGDPRETTRD